LSFRIIFAGTPEFAASALFALINRAFDVVAIYTQPDRPAGRGMKLTPSAVKLLSQRHALPVLQPSTLKSPEAQAALAALKPDLMIVAAYGLILPQTVLDIPRLGCLNIHASLLPRWRGAAPIQRALLAGDAETGIGIMRMEAGLDTGPVLLEKRTPISPSDTAGTLHDRLAALGAEAIVETVERLSRGETIVERPQASDGVTYASKINPAEARIDWRAGAAAIERQVRAFNPNPGAWTTWRGEKLKIWSAHALSADGASAHLCEAGEIVSRSDALWVACNGINGDKSVLAITEIQRAGGKRTPVSAWLSGSTAPQRGDRFE
jgi:methionyl-tRNA formyltransferase